MEKLGWKKLQGWFSSDQNPRDQLLTSRFPLCFICSFIFFFDHTIINCGNCTSRHLCFKASIVWGLKYKNYFQGYEGDRAEYRTTKTLGKCYNFQTIHKLGILPPTSDLGRVWPCLGTMHWNSFCEQDIKATGRRTVATDLWNTGAGVSRVSQIPQLYERSDQSSWDAESVCIRVS